MTALDDLSFLRTFVCIVDEHSEGGFCTRSGNLSGILRVLVGSRRAKKEGVAYKVAKLW
jgi:hypothetical protein